eukprot:GEMP01010154.1.p1 GENE.GEMP01010154.1~~GEMP01010154.1.p1  ORF type:complete len:457 (+),score=59.82 GEMP01010154.1:204-1574(+)
MAREVLAATNVDTQHDNNSDRFKTHTENRHDNTRRSKLRGYNGTNPEQTGELRHQQFEKTKPCKFYQLGICSKRELCRFAHDKEEQRPLPNLGRTRMCSALETGTCDDPECTFAHRKEELQATFAFRKTKLCKYFIESHHLYLKECVMGDGCRYAHSEAELRRNIDAAEKDKLEQNEQRVSTMRTNWRTDNLLGVPATTHRQQNQKRKQLQTSSVEYYVTYDEVTPQVTQGEELPTTEYQQWDAYNQFIGTCQQKRAYFPESPDSTQSCMGSETSPSDSPVMMSMVFPQAICPEAASGTPVYSRLTDMSAIPIFFDGYGTKLVSCGNTNENEMSWISRVSVTDVSQTSVTNNYDVVTTPSERISTITAGSYFGDAPVFLGVNECEEDGRIVERLSIVGSDADTIPVDRPTVQNSLLVKNTFLHFNGCRSIDLASGRRTQSMSVSTMSGALRPKGLF